MKIPKVTKQVKREKRKIRGNKPLNPELITKVVKSYANAR